MNFAELRFWGYLLTGVTVVLSLRWLTGRAAPRWVESYDKLGLLFLGLFLLLCVSWVTFIIFLAVALGTYVGLGWIQKHQAQHSFRYLWILIPMQLAPLFYYKYASFVAHSLLHLEAPRLRGLIIPVGISFYTFQKVAFVVDTLAHQWPLPRLLDYMNFAGFFPQIVAGPIERRKDLLPQMEAFRFRWLPQAINEGSGWIALGLFFKCGLADNLASLFTHAPRQNAYLVWLDNVLFGLRIYYDFAGYSLIALGVAHCLGIRLTLNFASPYTSTSISEFWRRWHITLSQWCRDYLYVPLGGGRVRFWAVNVAVVFLVSGIWHGAGWNFVAWGALHALFLISYRLGGRRPLPTGVAWALTMAASFYAWLYFYETDPAWLVAKTKLLLNPSAYRLAALHEAIVLFSPGNRVMLAGVLLMASTTLTLEWLSVRRWNEPYCLLRHPTALLVLVVLTVLLTPGESNEFIYFAF